ncbi:hypothetical protein DPQ33_03665 [Oceanidesulfovibrio indonesiensis]|uniref:LamG-like jellyroll fold domain-containing protein n=1 Tax=Oceanidesulfovibrio indonesiensis TaxID=54767 RepID=A0A7M3MJ25_9BACT|nr:LamG-like jellyroll fold domain-containing protein [Oceanidesulfovibrio indonesiensis]TVM19467.1 hypothetical protein DPQ33_03665 [Oceanidesulfovibrio indonesiensis]
MPISRNGLVLELLGELDGSTLLDTSDSAHHASTIGNVMVEQGGHPQGNAFVFNGSSAAHLPFEALITGTSPRTVAMWFFRETNTYGGNFETIYNAGSRQTGRWFDITLGSGAVEFLNYGYGEQNDTISFNYAGAWHFVCFQYDGAHKKAWINNSKVVDKSIYLDTGSGYHELAQREGSYRFQGRLARIRIWSRALSDAEVAAVYNESTSLRSTQRNVNTLGPSRADHAMAVGLGDCRSGLAAMNALGMESRRLHATGLGFAVSRPASLSLGTATCPAPAVHALGDQRLQPDAARLGRANHCAMPLVLGGAGRRTIARHVAPLTGTGRAFAVRHPSSLAGAAGHLAWSALDLTDTRTHRRSHSVHVFLDEDEITAAVLECNLDMDLDSPHDSVALVAGRGRSNTDAILDRHRPTGSAATPRLRLDIDGEAHVFLLEKRDERARTIRLAGRSPSALAEPLYATSITLGGGVLASQAAQVLAESCDLDIIWETHDWLLPETWLGSGPPMESLHSLAGAVGAFLRWDGLRQSLAVKEPHRSITSRSDILDFTDKPVLDANESTEHGTGRNAVTVLGHAVDIHLPRLEVEPPPGGLAGHLRGVPATVLAHWPAGRSAATWTWASHGSVASLGEAILWRRRVLTTFVMGRADLGESPIRLERVQWIGASAGSVRLSPGSTQLLCESGRSGVALLDYAIRVQRFLLSGHDVPALVFLVAASVPDRTGVRVIHGSIAAREEDETIEEPLITDQAGAVARGRSHLAWRSRPRRIRTVTLPYTSGLAPGAVIALDHGEHDIAGPCLVRAVRLEARGPKLLHHLELVQWTD